LGASAPIRKTPEGSCRGQGNGQKQLTSPALSTIGAHDSGCLEGRPFFFEFELKGMSDEAHLPAEQSGPQAASWLPQPDGDRRRPQGAERPPRARPQEAQRLTTLTKRSDFVAANSGLRASTPGFVLLVRERSDGDSQMRVGFTVTKKIGGA